MQGKEWIIEVKQLRVGVDRADQEPCRYWHSSRRLGVRKKEMEVEVSGQRKERDITISCLLENKREGREPWPP